HPITAATTNAAGVAVSMDLVVGLVGALGSDLTQVARVVTEELAPVRYRTHDIHLSHLLHDLPRWRDLAEIPNEYDRIKKHMDAGDELRQLLVRRDAMALLAIAAIREEREQSQEVKRRAFLL